MFANRLLVPSSNDRLPSTRICLLQHRSGPTLRCSKHFHPPRTVLYAASIYMALGRLIRSVHGERFSIVRPSWMTKIFVSGDLIALNVQSIGGGLTIHADTRLLGKYIVVVGLFIQLIGFGFFVVAASVFHIRMRRYVAKGSEPSPDVPWRQGLKMLYACSALIVIRSVFRIIEYIMGLDGYLLSHECQCMFSMLCPCGLSRWLSLFGSRRDYSLGEATVMRTGMCW